MKRARMWVCAACTHEGEVTDIEPGDTHAAIERKVRAQHAAYSPECRSFPNIIEPVADGTMIANAGG